MGLAAGKAFPMVQLVIATARIVGLMNAAIWLGASVFAVLGTGAATSSQAMEQLLTPAFYPYFSGSIAHIFLERYWLLHLACACIALLHLGAESLYFGRVIRKKTLGLLLTLLVLGILQKTAIMPALKRSHLGAHATNRTQIQKESALSSYRAWNGSSHVLNFVMMIALGVYLWRLANPPESPRFGSFTNYRG
jgi:hypothetical protein